MKVFCFFSLFSIVFSFCALGDEVTESEMNSKIQDVTMKMELMKSQAGKPGTGMENISQDQIAEIQRQMEILKSQEEAQKKAMEDLEKE